MTKLKLSKKEKLKDLLIGHLNLMQMKANELKKEIDNLWYEVERRFK